MSEHPLNRKAREDTDKPKSAASRMMYVILCIVVFLGGYALLVAAWSALTERPFLDVAVNWLPAAVVGLVSVFIAGFHKR